MAHFSSMVHVQNSSAASASKPSEPKPVMKAPGIITSQQNFQRNLQGNITSQSTGFQGNLRGNINQKQEDNEMPGFLLNPPGNQTSQMGDDQREDTRSNSLGTVAVRAPNQSGLRGQSTAALLAELNKNKDQQPRDMFDNNQYEKKFFGQSGDAPGVNDKPSSIQARLGMLAGNMPTNPSPSQTSHSKFGTAPLAPTSKVPSLFDLPQMDKSIGTKGKGLLGGPKDKFGNVTEDEKEMSYSGAMSEEDRFGSSYLDQGDKFASSERFGKTKTDPTAPKRDRFGSLIKDPTGVKDKTEPLQDRFGNPMISPEELEMDRFGNKRFGKQMRMDSNEGINRDRFANILDEPQEKNRFGGKDDLMSLPRDRYGNIIRDSMKKDENFDRFGKATGVMEDKLVVKDRFGNIIMEGTTGPSQSVSGSILKKTGSNMSLDNFGDTMKDDSLMSRDSKFSSSYEGDEFMSGNRFGNTRYEKNAQNRFGGAMRGSVGQGGDRFGKDNFKDSTDQFESFKEDETLSGDKMSNLGFSSFSRDRFGNMYKFGNASLHDPVDRFGNASQEGKNRFDNLHSATSKSSFDSPRDRFGNLIKDYSEPKRDRWGNTVKEDQDMKRGSFGQKQDSFGMGQAGFPSKFGMGKDPDTSFGGIEDKRSETYDSRQKTDRSKFGVELDESREKYGFGIGKSHDQYGQVEIGMGQDRGTFGIGPGEGVGRFGKGIKMDHSEMEVNKNKEQPGNNRFGMDQKRDRFGNYPMDPVVDEQEDMSIEPQWDEHGNFIMNPLPSSANKPTDKIGMQEKNLAKDVGGPKRSMNLKGGQPGDRFGTFGEDVHLAKEGFGSNQSGIGQFGKKSTTDISMGRTKPNRWDSTVRGGHGGTERGMPPPSRFQAQPLKPGMNISLMNFISIPNMLDFNFLWF